MPETFTLIADLLQEAPPPADGILSRTVYSDDRLKAIVFGFGAGQELSEHTSSLPAVIHILSGEAALTLGADSRQAGPGTWVHMPAGLKHSVRAETPVVMLLLLLKGAPSSAGE